MFFFIAGPLALARKHLKEDNEPFFVLNSDVMCSFPFAEMEKFHKAHGKEGTIMVMQGENSLFHSQLICDFCDLPVCVTDLEERGSLSFGFFSFYLC